MTGTRVVPIGACQLDRALSSSEKDGRMNVRRWIWCYTTVEALQQIRFFQGAIEIHERLYPYCGLPREFEYSAVHWSKINEADLVLVEPNSIICTYFESYALNRASFHGFLDAFGSEKRRETNDWLLHGVLGCNEDRRREAANRLLQLLPPDIEDREIVRELLVETRGRRQDFEEYVTSIAEIRDMVPSPMALVAYIHQYLPDGRPLPWPPEHLEYTIEAARRLDLPIFNPADIVAKFGVDKAMNEARTLYRDEFCPVIGDHLYAFVRDVIDRKAATFIERSTDPVAAAK